jgi:hypothetical protein
LPVTAGLGEYSYAPIGILRKTPTPLRISPAICPLRREGSSRLLETKPNNPLTLRRRHMNVKTRKTLLALFGMLVFAGISLPPTLSQNRQRSLLALPDVQDCRGEEERSYSPEGAWFCTAKIPGVPVPVPYMDIYTSDSEASGTVLCTLSVGKFASPMGIVSMTQAGHGNWIRTGKNQFAFTAWRIIIDADGRPVGTAKFWGALTATTHDETSGTMNAEYYTPTGDRFLTITGLITKGKRIQVEVEGQ